MIKICSKDKYGRYMTEGSVRVLCLPDKSKPREYHVVTSINDDQITYVEVVLSGDNVSYVNRRATCCYVGLTIGVHINTFRRKNIRISWYKSGLDTTEATKLFEHMADLISERHMIEAIALCVDNGFTYDHQ